MLSDREKNICQIYNKEATFGYVFTELQHLVPSVGRIKIFYRFEILFLKIHLMYFNAALHMSYDPLTHPSFEMTIDKKN